MVKLIFLFVPRAEFSEYKSGERLYSTCMKELDIVKIKRQNF